MIELIGVGDDDRLSAVDLIVEAGAPVVLFGPPGAGKTRLLRLIAGLDRPHRGQVKIGDGAPTVAMVQAPAVNYPTLSVHENIAAPLRREGLAIAEIERRVRAMARLMGLGRVPDSRPAQLSADQRQCLAIARALVKEPDILLLDDPLAGLGYGLRNSLRDTILAVLAERGGVTIYATNDPREAMTVEGLTAVLDHGRIVQSGRFRDIHRAPATLGVGEITGQPPINVFNGRLENSTLILEAAAPAAIPEHFSELAGGAYRFALRADHIALSGRTSGDIVLPATVEWAENNGIDTTVHARHGGAAMTAMLSGGQAVEFGASVNLVIDPARLLAYDMDGVMVAAPDEF